MELTEARTAATTLLEDMAGEPLRLAPGDEHVADVGWAWAFAWSTAHWFDQRRTREVLGWTPRVTLGEGFRRLAASYAGSPR